MFPEVFLAFVYGLHSLFPHVILFLNMDGMGDLPYVYHPGRKFWRRHLPRLPGRETAYDKCFDGSMYRRCDYGTGISWQECILMFLPKYTFCDGVCVMVNKHRTQYVPPWIIRRLAGNHGGIFYVKKKWQ